MNGTLTLQVGGTAPTTLQVESSTTGKTLKEQHFVERCKDMAEIRLEYQNVDDDVSHEIDDTTTLSEQGVRDNAKVRTLSALRQNIHEKADFSYYYAHKRVNDLPEELKYAYGGGPTKLDTTEIKQSTTPKFVPIRKYAWNDEKEVIKIYISITDEKAAVAAAQNKDAIKFECDKESMQFDINAEESYALRMPLYGSILSADCKYRVTDNKITITLKKEKTTKWPTLTK